MVLHECRQETFPGPFVPGAFPGKPALGTLPWLDAVRVPAAATRNSKTNGGFDVNKYGLVSVAVGLAVATGGGASAQSGGAAAMLEEVVVTARKRQESIQDAPLTIQAFTDQQIEERGAQSLADIAKFSPGLTFNAGSSRAASDFSIRGMTQISAVGDNRRDLVTVFIDNVPYIGNPSGIGSEDLARVEIIKGPQSALFGRATFGGAISLVTTTPGEELRGKVSGTVGTYGDYRLSGAVEGPLIEGKLAGRVVVDGRKFDGFYRNAFGGRLGETDERYFAATLNFTPIEDLSVRVRYSDRSDEYGPAATTLIARSNEHNCGPFPGFQPRSLAGLPAGFTLEQSRRLYCGELKAPAGTVGINTTTPPRVAATGLLPFTEHKTTLDHELGAVTADWSFGGGHTLQAIASTQEQYVKGLRDFELAPEDRYQFYYENNQTQDTYEVRLTSPADQRLSWMIGVSRLENSFDVVGAFINGALFGPAAAVPTAASFNPIRSASETDSVFGSLGFRVTDAFDVSVEARRQKDTQTSGVGSPTAFSVDTTATLPRVLLRYALNDTTRLFANYAKGNQPTQGYATFFQLTPAQQAVALANGVTPVAPEAEVDNYEIGIKHRAADGQWYLNASLYYLEWVGRQGLRTIQIDLNGDGIIQTGAAPVGETFNVVPFAAGDSNTKGVEVDGAYRIGERWTLGGSAAYADTEITKALNEAVPLRFFGRTDSAGFLFPLAPKLSAAAFAQYEAPLTDARSWFLRTDLTYVGKRYDSILNVAYVPGQLRTNLRAGLRADAWEVTAFIDNLFDDDTLEASRYQSDSATDPFFFQLASSEAVLANKRQIGLTAVYRF
jgi:iron complex outermembrane receptor protein